MRTILITGANRGIGLGLTRLFLARGEAVIATARRPEKATDLAALRREFPKTLRIEALEVDSDASARRLARRLRGLRAIDVLINNAGVFLDHGTRFETIPEEAVLAAFQANVLGPMRVIRALLPWLKRSRAPVVANMSSVVGSIAANDAGGWYSYRMSKAALNMLNKSFSVDFPRIISVALHPGWVKTDMGTSRAPLTVEESARGLARVISGLGRKDSGRFLDYRGKKLPW